MEEGDGAVADEILRVAEPTEHEEIAGIGIRLEHPFGLRREAGEPLMQVRHAARQPYPGR